jgi:hypothetical protein
MGDFHQKPCSSVHLQENLENKLLIDWSVLYAYEVVRTQGVVLGRASEQPEARKSDETSSLLQKRERAIMAHRSSQRFSNIEDCSFFCRTDGRVDYFFS